MRKFIDFCLNIIPVSQAPLSISRKPLQSDVVAHALGQWNGENYLNCQEAFEENYAKGLRLFETDFSLTSDGAVVLFHDGHEERFGLKKSFTEVDFLSARPFGSHLLNLEALGKLLLKYPDSKIITDVKDDNLKVLMIINQKLNQMGVNVSSQIIPQIYHPSEFPKIKAMGFEQMIFTVYRFKKRKNLTARFLRQNPEISALTVPDKWIEKKNYVKLAKQCDIDIFVHSINDEKRREQLKKLGVRGIYSHQLF